MTGSRVGFRQRAEYRFGVVLLLLLATFTFMAAGITGAWTGVVTVLLQGATLIAALSAAQVARRLVRLAAVVTVGALIVATATAPTSGTEPSGFVARRAGPDSPTTPTADQPPVKRVVRDQR